MLETIPVPAQSKFGAAVARRLNASRPIAPAGSLAMSGPTGTGFAQLPANLRDRRGVSATQPRQFDIRARVESRVNGDSKEYRLVVEFYHSTDDAVSLSGKSVSYTGGQQTISAGWNDLYTSSWSSDLDESKQYYLNVWIGAVLEEDGKWTGFNTNDTRWWISDTQTSHVHSTRGNMALFRHGYLLGSVVAKNSLTSVAQKFDGPLMFLDFVELGRSGGGGGGGGDGGDPDNPDDPNPPSGDGVTSLNGVDGDLVLRLLEGWLEIVKGGQAKKAIGTVVTSVSGLYGDMAVIGGKKIRVDQEGNSLKISYDDEKETEDTNPFPDSPEVCEHPGGGGGAFASGGGRGGGVQGGGGESGGGDSCCGGASAAGGSATGMPEPGVSGKPATGGSGTNGKEITGPQTPEGGKEAGGGLFNGSTIPKKKIEDTNTHGSLTDTKKMTTSPFAKDPNWHGSIEDTAGNSKKPIYTGTHNALTDTKKMTESPFKRK